MPYYLGTTVIAALAMVSIGVIALYFGYWRYRGRRSSTMLPEKRAKLLQFSRLLGIGAIALGIVTYAWEVMTPLSAEKIVQIERSKAALPMDMSALVRWDSIEAVGQRVTYVYTLRKTPRGISERFALISGLRQQITDYLCEDRLYRAAVERQISFELDRKSVV